MRAIGVLIAFLGCLPCVADARLDSLHKTLLELRGKPVDWGGPRGAVAKLTVAKHQLRDWAESRLATLPRDGEEHVFAQSLNRQLKESGAAGESDYDAFRGLGYVGELKVQRSGAFLVLTTSVSIQCGVDSSAYVFGWSDEGWRRVWQNEQNVYVEGKYKPQFLTEVLISPWSPGNNYVVLTLGFETWCASNWHSAYYRAFRLGPDPMAEPLAEGDYYAFHPERIRGSVTDKEILVEFTVGSIDTGVHNRQAVRRYRIDGNTAKRIDPLALKPRDFVDEWLTHDWREAAFWSESDGRVHARQFHEKLRKRESKFGEFLDWTQHCPQRPDLWQVGMDFTSSDSPTKTEDHVWFLVRWRPPFRFTMVNVSDKPAPDCNQRDRRADEERNTMFPGGIPP